MRRAAALAAGLLTAAVQAAEPASLRTSEVFAPDDQTRTLADIVRAEHRYDGRFTWADYRRLLGELSAPRYRVLDLAGFAAAAADPTRVTVGMRHDIDSHPEKALAMAAIERELRLPSTYFILHSAAYYGGMVDGRMVRNAAISTLAQDLHRQGFEVGIHTDLFQVMWRFGCDPLAFITAEIASYAALGVPVRGAAAHGDAEVIRRKLNNMWMFAEFGHRGEVEVDGRLYPYGRHTVADYGLAYEAYRLPRDTQTGDIDQRLAGAGIEAQIALLAAIPAGQRVIILTHPEHWGRSATGADL